jgi:hypothetical protein
LVAIEVAAARTYWNLKSLNKVAVNLTSPYLHDKSRRQETRGRWSGYVKRTDEHRIPKRVQDMKMGGKTPRSRPQR